MNYLNQVPQLSPFIILVLFAWSMFWKGTALWKCAKYDQKNWFIVMLLVNTVGIVEIVYLFKFAKNKMELEELKFWKKNHGIRKLFLR